MLDKYILINSMKIATEPLLINILTRPKHFNSLDIVFSSVEPNV